MGPIALVWGLLPCLAAAPAPSLTAAQAEALVRDVSAKIEKIRGLKFKKPVTVSIIDGATARANFKAKIAPQAESEARHTQEAYIHLGLIPPQTDLITGFLDLAEKDVAGYYEHGGETKEERTVTNAEIVMNDVEQNGLGTAALAAAFPTSSNDAQVPVIVEVSGADLLKEAKENKVAVDFYIYAFDEQGTVRDRLYQQVTLDVAKVGPKLRANGLKYWATLALPPGKYAVKTLVTAAARKGFARADVVVPTASQLAAAPIFVDDNANWVLVKGTSHDKTSAAYPFDLSGEHFIPAATARTKRFAIFVPNAKPEDVTFETKPKVKFLGSAKSAGATALVMELEQPVSTVEVTVRKKGVTTPATFPLHPVP